MSGSRPGSTQTEKESISEVVAAKLEDWLPEKLAESGIPGAAVAVVGRRNIVWQKAFGCLDHPGSPPADTETLFCVRSLAKGITAVAVLVAVQDGLVDLDIPIKEYLPGFTVHSRFESNPEERITLRHLLAHWAGFTHDEPPGSHPDDPDLFQKHIQGISETWLRFPVRNRYAYTNLDYDLAGYLLQVCSGKPFAQYIKEKVLDPIGMSSSSFDSRVIEQSANRAVGHKPSGKIEPLRFPEIPAAGLYSNVQDMARYIQFHLGNGAVGGVQILPQDLMEQYHSVQFPRPNQRTGYCFGIYRQLVSNTFSFSHSGGGRGFQSQVIVYPALKFGVLLLTNQDGHGLTESPFQKTIDDLLRERFGSNPVFGSGIERMRELPFDDPRIQSVLGRYWDRDNWIIGFESGVMGLRKSSDAFFPLTFYEDAGELVGLYGDTNEIRFTPPFGSPSGLLASIDRRLLNCDYRSFNDSPGDPLGPGKKAWQVYFGVYDILWDNEPFAAIRITQRNGYLYYGEARCIEHQPGLFFTCDGEALDFRFDPPTAANLVMRRNKTHL